MKGDQVELRFALVLLVAATCTLGAKPTPKRKPSQTSPAPISIQVVYGEKVSNFRLSVDAGGFWLDSPGTPGKPRRRPVPAKDWRYLMERIDAIRGPSNDPSLCYRTTVTLTRGGTTTLGCLRAPNPVAKQLRDLVNLLSIYG